MGNSEQVSDMQNQFLNKLAGKQSGSSSDNNTMGNIISNTMGNEGMMFNPLMLNSELRINNQTSSVF